MTPHAHLRGCEVGSSSNSYMAGLFTFTGGVFPVSPRGHPLEQGEGSGILLGESSIYTHTNRRAWVTVSLSMEIITQPGTFSDAAVNKMSAMKSCHIIHDAVDEKRVKPARSSGHELRLLARYGW